jgi:hypothetical protein
MAQILNWKCKNGHPVPYKDCPYCDQLGELHTDALLNGMLYCPECQAYHTSGWHK